MNLTRRIETRLPSLDLEFEDERMQLRLLYREGDERIDVLATPLFKSDPTTAYFFQFLPDQALVGAWPQAKIHEEELLDHKGEFGGSSKYLVLTDTSIDGYVVFPYIAVDFPIRIMQSQFRTALETCTEKMEELDLEDPSLISVLYEPIREQIMQAFAGEKCASKILNKEQRKPWHLSSKDAESFCKPRSEDFLEKYLLNPLRYMFTTAEQNKVFPFLSGTEERVNLFKEWINTLRVESPEQHRRVEGSIKRSVRRAGDRYRTFLYGAALLGFVLESRTGLSLGEPLLGFAMAESLAGRLNHVCSGYYASIIGTIREKFGKT